MAGFSLICCVVAMGEATKIIKISKKFGIKGATISIGRGTIRNPIMNFLALHEDRREIVSMVVENEFAKSALKAISIEMKMDKPHHGVAFLYPVDDFIGSKNAINNPKIIKKGNSMYKIIFVIVEKGRGEEVIEAANKVISIGGTIINARGAGVHEIQKFFDVEIEPEKEEVFIITRNKNKDKIVNSIRENLKIDEPGNGILYVLDVNEVYGLHGVN